MKYPHRRRVAAAFTLIELMIAIAVMAILLTLAAPSFFDFILMQRLKSVSAQVGTDMQFARSEAASRNLPVRVRFSRNSEVTCYAIFTGSIGACDCLNSPVCPTSAREIRTMQVRKDVRVELQTPALQSNAFEFDPATGAIVIGAVDFIAPPPQQFNIDTFVDTARSFRTVVNLAGRPSVCAPPGSTMAVPAC